MKKTVKFALTDEEKEFIEGFRNTPPEIKTSLIACFIADEVKKITQAKEDIKRLQKMMDEYARSAS